MKKMLFLILSLLAFLSNAQDSTTRFLNKYVINYSEKEFGENYNAQNWSIAQSKEGILYFGNSFYVLTYDGSSWNAIPMTEKSNYITALLSDANNIYWGANGDIGLIKETDTGKQRCVSLLDSIHEKNRDFSIVWRILKYENNIVFFSQEKLFLYNTTTKKIKVIHPKESFHLAFVANNQLFVRDRDYGLKKFNGTDFQPVADGKIFENEGIFGMFPINISEILIVTQQIGLYYYDQIANTITKIDSYDTKTLNKLQIIGGIKLSDGNIALNTASNGIVIINSEGQIVSRITIRCGIADNDIKSIFQDNNHNLWLATNNGISFINYSSPISFFPNNNNSGLYGGVNTIEKINNKIFIGTTTGLYTYPGSANTIFDKVPGLSQNITGLCSTNYDLIVGTNNATYQLDNNKFNKIASLDVSSLLWAPKNKQLFIIGENGLAVLQNNNRWNILKKDNSIRLKTTSIVNVPDNNNGNNLWIGTLSNGFWKVSIDKNLNITKTIFNENDGIGDNWIIPFLLNKKLFATIPNDIIKEMKVELPQDSMTHPMKPFFISDSIIGISKGIITHFVSANYKYWLVYNGKIARYDTIGKLFFKPFLSINFGKINTLLPINDDKIWIGTNNGLIYVDLNKQKDYSVKPDIHIRSFRFLNDSILFYQLTRDTIYSIDFNLNSFSINFSSLYNENGETPLYSFQLENYDNEWSAWNNNNVAIYKKINPGTYTFKVKAKNIYDVESDVATFNIEIATPWFLTVWAYLFYGILLILMVYLIVLWQTAKLKKKQKELERIVQERTREISRQKAEIENIHNDLSQSIDYAKRLQQAILPSEKIIRQYTSDYFVLFKPKDKVSGDFYWWTHIKGHTIITAVDCTGHGVPGAFMSMLGVSLLREIVQKEHITHTGIILSRLRKEIVISLKQKGESGEQKDGMDMSLISIDHEKNTVQFSGANNPLYVVKNEKLNIEHDNIIEFENTDSDNSKFLYEVKADKMPIAIYEKMDDFSTTEIQTNAGDLLYLFSDGYADQFGGLKGKKFKYKPFKQAILDNANKPMQEQKETLDEIFKNWKTNVEQIDDVVVVGIKI